MQWEVLNEILTPEQARDYYGVIVVSDNRGDPVVDEAGTAAFRRAGRAPSANGEG